MEVEFDPGNLHACSSIPRYTEQEGEALEKLLRKEETFIAAQHTLIYWLKRREDTEENCAQFRKLVELCLDRYERLLATTKEDDFQNVVNEMEKVLNAVDLRDASANFTPNQVTALEKMTTDVKNMKKFIIMDAIAKQKFAELKKYRLHLLKTEVDCLTNQLNASEEKIKDLTRKLEDKQRAAFAAPWPSVQKEAELISSLFMFLFLNPRVEVKCIYSHLKNKYPIDEKEIENILRKNPSIFEESSRNETTKVWNCTIASPEVLAEFKKNVE